MICAPIKEKDILEVISMIKKVPRKFDLIEVWTDEIEKLDENGILEICHAARKKPLIFKLTKQINFSFLSSCLNKKIQYFDIDNNNDQTTIQRIKSIIGDKKIILSHQDNMKTPLFTDILEMSQQMKLSGADVIKITTEAVKIDDNLAPLRLLTNSTALGLPIISFCTGELGRMSRIYASKFGSFIDYILPSEKFMTAKGQLLFKDFKKIQKCV
jgi:3-dehydroquinate dehydratase type I